MATTLAPESVKWMGVRFLDPHGRVFEHEGEFYRAIYPASAAFMDELFRKGIIENLVRSGLLVETRPTDLHVPGFASVLHHRKIPFITKAGDWSRTFLKDAALCVLDLNIELLKYGMGTIDYHSANIQQQGRGAPVWIDLGSILPLGNLPPNESFPAEFANNFLYPLLLYAKSPALGRICRILSHAGGLSDVEFSALVGEKINLKPVSASREAWLRTARAFVTNIEFPELDTFWKEYHSGGKGPTADLDESNGRNHAIKTVLANAKPKRVVDLGCNAGRFSLLAARMGAQTFAADFDEGAIERLHGMLKQVPENLSITGAIRDLSAPQKNSPVSGDMALALALSHHLSLGQRFPFAHIAEVLSSYSTEGLLTEFMPNGLGGVRRLPDPLPAWYTLESFRKAFEPHFRKIETIEFPNPPPNSPRILVYCTGKR